MRREDDGGGGPSERGGSEDLDHLEQLQRHRRSRLAKVIVALVILVILIVFITTNYTEKPNVHYVFASHRTHLIWIMLTCAILGGIVGFLVGRPGKQFRFHGDQPPPKE